MSKLVTQNQTDQINHSIKVLRTVKNGIIDKTEDAKLKIKYNFFKNCNGKISIVRKERILSLLDRYDIDVYISKMISDEVFGLVREIEKEFDRSLSLLNLRVLDVDFDIPE